MLIFAAAKRAVADKKNVPDLLSAMAKQLEELRQKPGYEQATIYDLLRSYAKGNYDIADPVSVTAIKADKLQYPLDLVNFKVWRDLTTSIIHPLKAETDSSTKQLSVYYSIDFDELGKDIAITKELTQFDKRVYIATAALHDAGNEYTTLSKIYETMGYSGRPSPEHLEKINAALTKMGTARITVNNREEADFYHYPRFVNDGALLPFERVTAVINGKATEAAIHIFRQPPLITFAKQRKQLTTIDAKLLQSPINKTESTLALEDYLIARISHAARGNQPQRILYKTLFERTGTTEHKQKQRAKEKIQIFLDHYKKCGFIADYATEADGITVSLPQAEAPTKAKRK